MVDTNEITITEALAEIKTLKARIAKKREAVKRYLVRDAMLKDPLVEQGGGAEYIKKERQSIGDMETRIVTIRSQIQTANTKNVLAINGRTMTVGQWLNWRREVAPEAKGWLTVMVSHVESIRNQARSKNKTLTSNADTNDPNEVIVNLDEKALADESEMMEKTLGDLDGKLSLFNATQKISI